MTFNTLKMLFHCVITIFFWWEICYLLYLSSSVCNVCSLPLPWFLLGFSPFISFVKFDYNEPFFVAFFMLFMIIITDKFYWVLSISQTSSQALYMYFLPTFPQLYEIDISITIIITIIPSFQKENWNKERHNLFIRISTPCLLAPKARPPSILIPVYLFHSQNNL